MWKSENVFLRRKFFKSCISKWEWLAQRDNLPLRNLPPPPPPHLKMEIFWPPPKIQNFKIPSPPPNLRGGGGCILCVSFHFFAHIEWSRGNAYLFFYLQIGDRYYNTDFVHVRPRRVKQLSNNKEYKITCVDSFKILDNTRMMYERAGTQKQHEIINLLI